MWIHYVSCDYTKTVHMVLYVHKDQDNYCMFNLYGGYFVL